MNRLAPETAGRVFDETLSPGSKPLQDYAAEDYVRAIHGASYTRLAIEGVPPAALMKIAGHKNMATTMAYYIGVSNAELKRLVLKASSAG